MRFATLLLAFAAILASSPAAAASASTIDGVRYRTVDGEQLLLDACLPSGSGPFPALVLVHGGGWSKGSRSELAPECQRAAAEDGMAAFTIDYRLAPTDHAPAAVDDLRAALRWVRANAAAYRIDPDRIYCLGSSAGGLDVYVPQRIRSPGNPPTAKHPVKSHIDAGWHEMDGTDALSYARSRDSDSDYHRMARQRCLLASLAAQKSPLQIAANWIALSRVITGSLHSLLEAVKDQGFLLLEVFGEFRRILELASRQALGFLKRVLQNGQSERLIAFGIGTIHSTDKAKHVIGQTDFEAKQGKEE